METIVILCTLLPKISSATFFHNPDTGEYTMSNDINTMLMEQFYNEAQTYGLSDNRSQLYANWRMVRDGHGSISKFLKENIENAGT